MKTLPGVPAPVAIEKLVVEGQRIPATKYAKALNHIEIKPRRPPPAGYQKGLR